MKKSILFLFFLSSLLSLQAQENVINTYFNQYSKDQGFTKVSVTSKMFSLFTELDTDDENEKEILEAMSKLKGIKGIYTNRSKSEKIPSLYQNAVAKVQNDSRFEELMTVEDSDENVTFFIRENQQGTINELVMILGGNQNFMVMSVYGEIDLASIIKTSKALNIKGMEKFGTIGQ